VPEAVAAELAPPSLKPLPRSPGEGQAGGRPAREPRPSPPRPTHTRPAPSFLLARSSVRGAGDPGVLSQKGRASDARGGACAHVQTSGPESGRGRKGWCSRFPGLPEGAGAGSSRLRRRLESLWVGGAHGGHQAGKGGGGASSVRQRAGVSTPARPGGKAAVSPGAGRGRSEGAGDSARAAALGFPTVSATRTP
jgi:hypothetical protein